MNAAVNTKNGPWEMTPVARSAKWSNQERSGPTSVATWVGLSSSGKGPRTFPFQRLSG